MAHCVSVLRASVSIRGGRAFSLPRASPREAAGSKDPQALFIPCWAALHFGQPCREATPQTLQPCQANMGRGTPGRPSSTWVDKTSSCLYWGKQCPGPHKCPPGTYGWDLIRNWVFVGGLKLRPSYAGLGVGPKSNDRCPYKKKAQGDLGTQRRSHVTVEAETGGTWPRTPEGLGSSDAPAARPPPGRRKEHLLHGGPCPPPLASLSGGLRFPFICCGESPRNGASGGPWEFETGTQEQAVLPLPGCLCCYQTHRLQEDALILLDRPTAMSDSHGGEASWGYI